MRDIFSEIFWTIWPILHEIFNSPWFGIISCGFLPGLYLLYSALRIYRRGEITLSSPGIDKLGGVWHRPVTLKGKDVLLNVWIYAFFGLLILCIATTIGLSMIIR